MFAPMNYIAYYRTSKDGKGRAGLGLDAQRAIVTRFYTIETEFIEVKSAKTITDRPVLQDAMRYCIANNCGLVVARVDRLSRDVDDCRLILKQLTNKLFACDIPGTIDKFTLTLYAAFAERERELISIRTSQALQAKIKRDGAWQKGNASESFRKAGNEANKAKAQSNINTVRASETIRQMIANGLNYAQISAKLNENEFKTANNCSFTPVQVKRIAERSENHVLA
jgi:DNA invertase Pin-like site-specific DNA recombinase